ncbi:MAG: gephyrin-like molybdotransferase Glp, partial [Pseudomonadota bacterium]
MDGYAVKAKDTFGATESLPAMLEVMGEVGMGHIPSISVGGGQAVKISTGGMIPHGSDGVVMIEHCHLLDDMTIEVSRPIAPLENVIQPNDDFRKGETILKKGWRLRPQDVGILAGFGISKIPVYKRPKVAIISTGDEIVPISEKVEPGKVRDINSYTLSAFCSQTGAVPILMGLCTDNYNKLRGMVEEGLEIGDTVWISGGSSVGSRDITLKVLESLSNMEILVHGISISPGKPTIIARIGCRAVFGLPGHTASAMVVAEVFLTPFIARISGQEHSTPLSYYQVEAELRRNIESASGREDYIRVRLVEEDGKLKADPIFGKSALISTLVNADGLVRVDRNKEGLYQGEIVKVMMFHYYRG